jgi:hypothetical protein
MASRWNSTRRKSSAPTTSTERRHRGDRALAVLGGKGLGGKGLGGKGW